MTDAPALPPLPPELAVIITTVVRLAGGIRQSQFEEQPPPSGSIVMLGDSITEGGLWNEWFPSLPIVNRGIGGDTAEGVRARLTTSVVEPLLVSLLIGTVRRSLAGARGRVGCARQSAHRRRASPHRGWLPGLGRGAPIRVRRR